MVRIHPDPPTRHLGAVAQLGEHLLCKQGVVGSIPISSTTTARAGARKHASGQSQAAIPLRSGHLAGGYRLFFNNWEEVAGTRPRSNGRVSGWIVSIASHLEFGWGVDSANARDVAREQCATLWGQATKCMWWMPWRSQAKKDVAACEKLRGAGKRAMIRRCPNGETRPVRVTPI